MDEGFCGVAVGDEVAEPRAPDLLLALQEATELTGSPLAPYHTAALMAMRGREDEAKQFITAARAAVTTRGEGAGLSFMDWAEAMLCNGLGTSAWCWPPDPLGLCKPVWMLWCLMFTSANNSVNQSASFS